MATWPYLGIVGGIVNTQLLGRAQRQRNKRVRRVILIRVESSTPDRHEGDRTSLPHQHSSGIDAELDAL